MVVNEELYRVNPISPPHSLVERKVADAARNKVLGRAKQTLTGGKSSPNLPVRCFELFKISTCDRSHDLVRMLHTYGHVQWRLAVAVEFVG